MEEVERELPAIWDLADEMREPTYSGWRPIWSAMLALHKGRLEEAEQLIVEYTPVVLRTQHPNWRRSLTAQFYDLRSLQGRLEEVEQMMVDIEREDEAARPTVQTGLANLRAVQGDLGGARHWFDQVAAEDFSNVLARPDALVILLLCADLARRLQDRERAALLYDILLPYADRQVVLPILVLCLGSASRALGQLAATLGRWEDAERHFEYAVAFDERIGATPWLLAGFQGWESSIRRRAVEHLRLRPGDAVLDVACGRGSNFPYVVDAVGSDGRIVGVDYSAQMLAGAEEAVAKNRWTNVRLVEGDAAEIGYSASFDGALCTIAMTVIPDWQRALREMIAAVRSDKRIVVMDGCRPSGLARLGTPYAQFFSRIVAADLDRDVIEECRSLLTNIEEERRMFGTYFIISGEGIASV